MTLSVTTELSVAGLSAALGKQDRWGYLLETLWGPVRLFPPENRRVRVSVWATWVPPPPPPFHHYHLPHSQPGSPMGSKRQLHAAPLGPLL